MPLSWDLRLRAFSGLPNKMAWNVLLDARVLNPLQRGRPHC